MYKKRNFNQTLDLLLNSRDEFKKLNGSLNVTAAAKLLGLNQPTLKRMLDGATEIPERDNGERICKYFKIDWEQMIGKKPIAFIDLNTDEQNKEYAIEEVAKLMDANDEEFRKNILDYARFVFERSKNHPNT